MKPRLVLFLLLALPGATIVDASPRQVNTPAHRALDAQRQRSAEEQARRESMRPGIVLVAPSPNQVIGTISRINLERGFVVGWLHTRYMSLSGYIIARDEQLRTTAVLSVGSARNQRAASLKIVSGVPNVGDEIVIVGTVPSSIAANTQATEQQAADTRQPPPSLRPQWQQQPAQTPALAPATARPAVQAQEQPQLIPAQRMRGLSGKPEVETRITVTVE